MPDGRPSERGIFEIADDTGYVIAGINRLRLGSEFSIERNDADPSCVLRIPGSSGGSASFDSVSAIRAFNGPLVNGRMYSTSGYYSPGDRGGAYYTWDSTSTDTDNGGSVIKVTSRSTGRMKLVPTTNNWNVRHFGAKGDNAATDVDRDAIRTAIAVAAAHSFVRTIYVPAGKYNMLHGSTIGAETPWSLLLTDDLTLVGDGRDSVLFWPGNPPPGPLTEDPMDHNVVMVRGSNVTIRYLCFVGENGDEDGTGYRLTDLYAQHSAIDTWFVYQQPELRRGLVIDHCIFRNLHGFSAHDQGGQMNHFRYANNVSMYCGNGENLCGQDGQHLNNTFISAEGIEVSGPRQLIASNYFCCDPAVGGDPGISLSGYITSLDYATNGVTVANNVIDGLGSTVPIGIVVNTYSNVSISGNVIKNIPTASIEVVDSHGISIVGNTIFRDRPDGMSGIVAGIFVSGLSDSCISGNTIRGAGHIRYGIEMVNSSRCTVSGNSSYDCILGDYGFGSSSDITVSDNQSYYSTTPAGTYGFLFQSCTNFMLRGNKSSGHSFDISVEAGCANIRSADNVWSTTNFAVSLIETADVIRIEDRGFSASSITIPFNANQYRRLSVKLDIDGGYIASIKLTGLSTGTYNYEQVYGNGVVPASAGLDSQNEWVPPGTSAPTNFNIDVSLPPAPTKKGIVVNHIQSTGATIIGGTLTGNSSDITHDPTAIVITFDTTRSGYLYALGYK